MGQYSVTQVTEPKSLMSALPANSQQLARRFESEVVLSQKRADVVNVSVFDGEQPANANEIAILLKPMQDVWTNQSPAFWSAVKMVVAESGISTARLKFCVTQFMLTHTYGKSFTPAELIAFDKTITVARSMQALRDKVKYTLEYEDIVMVEFFGERRFVLTEEAEMYKMNILARYTSPYGTPQWVGTYKSQSFVARKKAFGEAIKEYLKYYPREMCIEFYKYWSRPVQCGDMMLKDIQWSKSRYDAYGKKDDLVGEYIAEWAEKHGYKSHLLSQEEYEKSKS